MSTSPQAKFLGVGFKFPYSIDASGSTGRSPVNDTDEARVQHMREKAIQVFGPRRGERVMRAGAWGAKFVELVFEGNNEVAGRQYKFFAVELIELWEKRIKIPDNGATIIRNTAAGRMELRLAFEIVGTNLKGNLVWPFYVTE